MITELRKKFNQEFTEAKYDKFVGELKRKLSANIDFRVSETPLFLSDDITNLLIKACDEIIAELTTPEYKKYSQGSIPENLIAPNEADHPVFLQIDFAIAKDTNGNLVPRLIELQGFPSLYGFKFYFQNELRKHFDIPDEMTTFFSGNDEESYAKKFTETLLGNSAPENVILLEIDPKKQKTYIDFSATELMTGVKPICISDVIKRGRKLFYKQAGVEIPIERIYNRVIYDELFRTPISRNFDFTDDLDVHWVGHPNWFFKISKYTLPFLKSEFAPECSFLHELESYPEDLENYVLKPLYSFAGLGVEVDVTKEKLESIKDKSNYILQRKIEYAPLIETPDGYSKCEIRMMYLWNEKPELVNNLVRMSKGKMMGVDFNKNKTWIGSSCGFHYNS